MSAGGDTQAHGPDLAALLAGLDPGLARLAGPLDALAGELLRWNQHINLTGYREPREVWVGLFLDACALLPHLRGMSLLDIGSGAGFPGLVLALARPDMQVTLLEGRAKRVSFQKQAARLLGLGNVRCVLGRAGAGALPGERFDCVTVKAVSSLAASLELARPHLAPDGRVLLPRGLAALTEARALGLTALAYELPPPGGRRALVIAGPA